jgi:type I restriction enzyme S subunit
MKDEYVPEGISFLRSQNIHPFRLNLADIKFVTPEFHAKLKKSALKPGDVAVVRTGYPGTACVIPKSLPVSNCSDLVIISPNETELDSGYLAAVFNSSWGMATVGGNLVGAAQQHFNVGAAKEMELNLPDLPTQRKIAGILSAYDDLIENNLRRIKILEEMAQSLYREWFVHFRFPGHESTKFVDSELGQIPKGWGITDLEKVTTKIGSGATPRGGKDSYKTDGITLIRSMNIYDYSFEFDNLAFIDPKQAAQLDNVSVEAQDVLLNITGASVCRCAMVPSNLLPARVNQHVAIIRADTELMDPYFLLDSINSEQNKKALFSLAQGGATREALTKETICRFQILLPERDLIFRYGRIAGAMHTQREILQRKNQTLRRTRDLLLPKLLSGQIHS